jgi:hypothetical protein
LLKSEYSLFKLRREPVALPLRRAVNACVGPVRFPTIEIILRRLEAFEAESFQRCPFRMSDTTLDFPFPIRMSDPAR